MNAWKNLALVVADNLANEVKKARIDWFKSNEATILAFLKRNPDSLASELYADCYQTGKWSYYKMVSEITDVFASITMENEIERDPVVSRLVMQYLFQEQKIFAVWLDKFFPEIQLIASYCDDIADILPDIAPKLSDENLIDIGYEVNNSLRRFANDIAAVQVGTAQMTM